MKSNFSSAEVMAKVIRGKYPGMPNIYLPVVDVRDVAEAHLRAITMSPPTGRYIMASDNICFADLGQAAHDHFKQYGYKPNKKKMSF